MKTNHSLYGGKVELVFDPDARSNRYIANGKPVPGVTYVLDKALHKPGLMTYPLSACLEALGCVFDDDTSKWTTKDGKPLTASLNALDQAAKAWTRRADKGKDVGTDVHILIEQYLSNKPKPEMVSPQAEKPYLKFVEWFESHDIKVLAVEQIVYSQANDFAGTFDCLLEIDGQIVMCDIKTSNVSRSALRKGKVWTGIYPENFLQLGAYSKAWGEEQKGITLDAGVSPELLGSPSYVDDLMVINVTKQGQLHTLRASELGFEVEDCEQQFLRAKELVDFLKKLKKFKMEEE